MAPTASASKRRSGSRRFAISDITSRRSPARATPIPSCRPSPSLRANRCRLDDVARALDGADLVVVENLVSLPAERRAPVTPSIACCMVGARSFAITTCPGSATCVHELRRPAIKRPGATSRSTISLGDELTRAGHRRDARCATPFDCAPAAGSQSGRRDHRLALDERVVIVMPTRAIPRKNVAGALASPSRSDATLWLLGPAEDGFDDALDDYSPPPACASCVACHGASTSTTPTRRVTWSSCPPRGRGLATRARVGDPSSSARRLPLPGTRRDPRISVFVSSISRMRRPSAASLTTPDEGSSDHNLALAVQHFNVADLPGRLATVLEAVGIK